MSDHTLSIDGALFHFDIIHAMFKDDYWTPGIARAQESALSELAWPSALSRQQASKWVAPGW